MSVIAVTIHADVKPNLTTRSPRIAAVKMQLTSEKAEDWATPRNVACDVCSAMSMRRTIESLHVWALARSVRVVVTLYADEQELLEIS